MASHTFPLALVGRCLQSSVAAVTPAVAMLIPIRYFAAERRGSALGLTAVGLAIGSALGPVIPALVISFLHWRWLFAMRGASSTGSEEVYWPPRWPCCCLASQADGNTSCLLALAMFVARVRTAREPFVEPKLLCNPKYANGLTVAFLINGIGCSLNVLIPLLLAKIQVLPYFALGRTQRVEPSETHLNMT